MVFAVINLASASLGGGVSLWEMTRVGTWALVWCVLLIRVFFTITAGVFRPTGSITWPCADESSFSRLYLANLGATHLLQQCAEHCYRHPQLCIAQCFSRAGFLGKWLAGLAFVCACTAMVFLAPNRSTSIILALPASLTTAPEPGWPFTACTKAFCWGKANCLARKAIFWRLFVSANKALKLDNTFVVIW